VAWSQWGTGFGAGRHSTEQAAETDSPEANDAEKYLPLVGWLVAILLMAGYGCVIGDGITGRKDGIFLDRRDKISLARLQVSMWTCMILSAFLTAALCNVTREGGTIDIVIPPAFGPCSRCRLISAGYIHKINMDEGGNQQQNENANWTELVKGDAKSNEKGRPRKGKCRIHHDRRDRVFHRAHQKPLIRSDKGIPDLDRVSLLYSRRANGYLTSKYLSPGKTEEDAGGAAEVPSLEQRR
jgi:hypothetical protein